MKSKVIIAAVCGAFMATGLVYYKAKSPKPMEEKVATRRIHFLPYKEADGETFDVGFEKWMIVFENVPPSDLQTCEMQRLYPVNSLEERGFVSIKNYVHNVRSRDETDSPFGSQASGILISAKGFLPGEEVTVRVRRGESDEFDYVTFYPCPIALHHPDGRLLCSGELTSINPALYRLNFAFDPSNKMTQVFTLAEGTRNGGFFLQDGPTEVLCYASVPESEGGTSVLEVTYQNGDVYGVELPWGSNFVPYLTGESQN